MGGFSVLDGNTIRDSYSFLPVVPLLPLPAVLWWGTRSHHPTHSIRSKPPTGISNRQDPMIKRSYNMRAQNSQVHRERSNRYEYNWLPGHRAIVVPTYVCMTHDDEIATSFCSRHLDERWTADTRRPGGEGVSTTPLQLKSTCL